LQNYASVVIIPMRRRSFLLF